MKVPECCDRCKGSLLTGTSNNKTWRMSWFTEEDLCNNCQLQEADIKNQLSNQGVNVSKLEGCGKVPMVSNSGKFIVEN